MGSLRGGMGIPPTVGFGKRQVRSPAGSVSERRKGAPLAMGFGKVGEWGGEEFMVRTGVG
jgi:hypothetical protein